MHDWSFLSDKSFCRRPENSVGGWSQLSNILWTVVKSLRTKQKNRWSCQNGTKLLYQIWDQVNDHWQFIQSQTDVPSRMTAVGVKLNQNAFQMIPNVSFFAVEKFWRPYPSKRRRLHKTDRTCLRRIPSFILSGKAIEFVRKVWSVVYPRRVVTIGVKLGQNALQTISNISFSKKLWYLILDLWVAVLKHCKCDQIQKQELDRQTETESRNIANVNWHENKHWIDKQELKVETTYIYTYIHACMPVVFFVVIIMIG